MARSTAPLTLPPSVRTAAPLHVRNDRGRHLVKSENRGGKKNQVGLADPFGRIPGKTVNDPKLEGLLKVFQPTADPDHLSHRPGGLEGQGQGTADETDADHGQSGN